MRRTTVALGAVLSATLVLGACVPITINVNFPQQKIESAASSIEDMVRTPPPPPAGPTPAQPGALAPPSAVESEGAEERRRGAGASPEGEAPSSAVETEERRGTGARPETEGSREGEEGKVPERVPIPHSEPSPQSGDGSVRVVREGGVVSVFVPRVAEAQVPELKTQTPEVMAAVGSRRQRFPQLSAAMAQGCIGENNQGLVEARPGTGCPPGVGALVSGENRDRMLIYRALVEQNNMPPGDLVRVQQAFAKTNRERAAPGTWVQSPDGQWTRR